MHVAHRFPAIACFRVGNGERQKRDTWRRIIGRVVDLNSGRSPKNTFRVIWFIRRASGLTNVLLLNKSCISTKISCALSLSLSLSYVYARRYYTAEFRRMRARHIINLIVVLSRNSAGIKFIEYVASHPAGRAKHCVPTCTHIITRYAFK
jgi:hypothetical protein